MDLAESRTTTQPTFFSTMRDSAFSRGSALLTVMTLLAGIMNSLTSIFISYLFEAMKQMEGLFVAEDPNGVND